MIFIYAAQWTESRFVINFNEAHVSMAFPDESAIYNLRASVSLW